MKYNLKGQVDLSESDKAALASIVPGLVITGNLEVKIHVATNTELPENLVEALELKVMELVQARLGAEVSVTLVSTEN